MPRLDGSVIARILLKHTPLVYLALALLWMRILVDLPHRGGASVTNLRQIPDDIRCDDLR
jgi:hypothetical protein